MTAHMPFFGRYCRHWPVVKFQNVVKAQSVTKRIPPIVWMVTACSNGIRLYHPWMSSPVNSMMKMRMACDQCQNRS